MELLSIAIFITAVFYFNIHFLMYHIAVMIVGEFARTQRGTWKNKITFSMFYHLEHHLFPAVPTIKLPELARRIDSMLPEIEKRSTF